MGFIKHTQKPQTPEESGISLSAPSWASPLLWDPKPAHMCRYRYYSAHKTPQFHLKVVSRWNTLAASKLGSGLCRQHRPGRPSAHHIPLQWGMAANLLLLHKPVPVIKTLNGSPLKGSGLFWSRVVVFLLVFFQGDFIRGKKKKDCGAIRRMCAEEIRIQWFSRVQRWCIYIPKHLLCSFYMWQRGRGEDETVLKEATVLISSEGSLLFFPHPFLSWARPLQKLTWPCVPCNMFT